eukprot:11458978-Ditylum_brightwellii.AAC.1
MKGSGAALTVSEQTAVDVWTFMYELHHIFPQIITTATGTVTTSLQLPTSQMHHHVTKLLSQLFCEQFLQVSLLKSVASIRLSKAVDHVCAGYICAICNAFIPKLAKAIYTALDTTNTWSLNEDCFNNGYGFCHNQVNSKNECSPLFLQVNDMLDSPKTKFFMSDLT